jgi:hypothetical protein
MKFRSTRSSTLSWEPSSCVQLLVAIYELGLVSDVGGLTWKECNSPTSKHDYMYKQWFCGCKDNIFLFHTGISLVIKRGSLEDPEFRSMILSKPSFIFSHMSPDVSTCLQILQGILIPKEWKGEVQGTSSPEVPQAPQAPQAFGMPHSSPAPWMAPMAATWRSGKKSTWVWNDLPSW